MSAAQVKHHTAPYDIHINKISKEAPWTWLTIAWRQLWQAPHITLVYGLIFALVSAGLFSLLFLLGAFPMILPMVGGFLLVGPLLAVGLYETARRLSSGQPVRLKDAILVKTAAPSQLAFMGVILFMAFFAWIRIAMLLFAFFSGIEATFPPIEEFFSNLLFTADGLALVVTGTAVGGVIALFIFSITAISIPMLMHRDVDAVTAAVTSFKAVVQNPVPMLLWAWLIVLLIVAGLATGFVGLIVTFPLVGLATWHAYWGLTS